MNDDGLKIIFDGQLWNVINTFKAAVMTCSQANKKAVYSIYVAPIFNMFAIFENVERFENNINEFIGSEVQIKPALSIMKNFMLNTINLDKSTTKHEMEQRIVDCSEQNWISLETRILQRLANSA